MILFLLFLALTVAAGAGCARRLFPASEGAADRWLQFVLGTCLVLGTSTAVLFLTVFAVGGVGSTALIVELVVLSAFTAWTWRGPARENLVPGLVPTRRRGVLGVVAALAVVGFGFTTWKLWTLSAMQPHGTWDAWAIWNVRARFLVRAEDWTAAFRVERGQPDYPLLLPLTVARFWTALGTETTRVPVGVAVAFFAATVSVLGLAVARWRGPERGWLAALVCVAAPFFAEHGISQDADVVVSLFLLITIVAFSYRARAPRRALILAGWSAALAAWTKNEGLLLLALLTPATIFVERGSARAIRERSVAFLTGVLPVAATVALFKTALAPPSQLFKRQGETTLDRIQDPGRYQLIAAEYWESAREFAGPLLVLVPIYVILMGARRRHLPSGMRPALLALALMPVGYFAIYVIAPFPLDTYLDYSLRRLLLHLWPSALFALFVAFPAPTRREESSPAS